MTQEKQEAIIGRLTVEYSDARQKAAMLENECRRVSAIAECLFMPIRRGDNTAVAKLLGEFPDKAELQALVDGLASERARAEGLRDRLRECGITV